MTREELHRLLSIPTGAPPANAEPATEQLVLSMGAVAVYPAQCDLPHVATMLLEAAGEPGEELLDNLPPQLTGAERIGPLAPRYGGLLMGVLATVMTRPGAQIELPHPRLIDNLTWLDAVTIMGWCTRTCEARNVGVGAPHEPPGTDR